MSENRKFSIDLVQAIFHGMAEAGIQGWMAVAVIAFAMGCFVYSFRCWLQYKQNIAEA